VDEGWRGRREDARRNHEAVIEAALELLASDPDAGMQEIADASGVGRTTVYRHFANREELYGAMHDHAVEHSWAVAQSITERDEPIAVALRDLSAAMVDVGVRYRFLLDQRYAATLQTSRSRDGNPIAAFFTSAQARGEIRDDFPLRWVISTFQALSLVAMQTLAAGREDRDATVDLLYRSLHSLLVAGPT
jgi:AcrR family transcriptional regulator